MATIDSILPGGIHTDPPAQREHEARANADWYHEERARARKVAALVVEFERIAREAIGHPVNELAETELIPLIRQLRKATPALWDDVAHRVGVKPPGEETRAQVIARFEQRLGALVSK